MMNYEVTGTPSQVVENVQSIFSVTKAEAELIVMSLLYNQDEEVVDVFTVWESRSSMDLLSHFIREWSLMRNRRNHCA